MADTRVVADAGCGIPVLERNRYFYGKPMTVRDFEAEQLYALTKSRFLNRQLVGAGIICGLQASVPAKFDRNRPTLTVTEGAALDCCGNLIVASEDATVEIKGLLQDGLNYLYISYDECVRQPVMASANVSSCAEVCCYNRIRETFTVAASPDPPFETNLTGSVSTGQSLNRQFIAGAKVEALKEGLVKASTLTDSKGNYQLNLRSAGTYTVRVRRRGYGVYSETKALQKRQSLKFDVTLEAVAALASPPQIMPAGGAATRAIFQEGVAATPPPAAAPPVEAASICAELTKTYFEEHLRECGDDCTDNRVFLAVIEVDKTGAATYKRDETARYRPVVYSNPMLHELMCAHFADFDNPHRTTALQVGALRSINHVGNAGSITGVENITLASDGTLQIEPDANNRKITLRAVAANSVSSVGTSKRVGSDKSFAREDHAHDIDADAVARRHLSSDVMTGLLVGDNAITIAPDAAQKNIKLSFDQKLLAQPAVEAGNVRSVGAARVPGSSTLYAREDHAHNLSLNEAFPDAAGHLKLSAGTNISIKPGKANNELVISGASPGSKVTTGEFLFGGVASQAELTSGEITHGAGTGFLTFVLAVQMASGDLMMGDTQFFADTQMLPALMAVYTPNSPTFRIRLRDRRQTREIAEWRIRWWAIPPTAAVAQGSLFVPAPNPPPDLRNEPVEFKLEDAQRIDEPQRFDETRRTEETPKTEEATIEETRPPQSPPAPEA